eukprot:7981059-Alexandrium_andersonii.AAC.1
MASTRCTAGRAASCPSRSRRSTSGGSLASAAAPANRSAAALPSRSSRDLPRSEAVASSKWPLTQRA